jgi:hypothetical protein
MFQPTKIFSDVVVKLFVRIDDLIMQSFNARVNFFQHVMIGSNLDASLAAMGIDRELLYECGSGWNADFRALVGDLIDFPSLDLSSPSETDEVRSELCTALARRRERRYTSSSSAFVI